MSQGAMQATNIRADNATPISEDLPHFQRRYHTHSPEAGRKASREVLARAAIPQSMPKRTHGNSPSFCSRSSVSQKRIASSNAARLVSHTQRVHQYITGGITAQSQPVQTASFSSKHLLAIRKMGMQVSAENRLLMVRSANADA